MSNKHRRLDNVSPQNNHVASTSSDSDLIFGVFDPTRAAQHMDLVAALRACNSFVDVKEDRSLDGLLKNRVGGKMFTLYNMANSGFYIRKSKSLRTESSRNLTTCKELYELEKGVKYCELIVLYEFWQIYASAFINHIDSVSLSERHPILLNSFELVGSILEVIDSSNQQWIGTKGIVIDERENVFKFITESNKQKLIPKSACTFRVENKGRFFVFFGPDLAGIGRSGSIYRTVRQRHPLAYH